jgi:hypothetical protein
VLTGAAVLLMALTLPITFLAGGSIDDSVRSSRSGLLAQRVIAVLDGQIPSAIVEAWMASERQPTGPAEATWDQRPLDSRQEIR